MGDDDGDDLPDGEAQGRIHEELGMPHEGAGHGQQGRDLTQGKLHGAHDQADGGIAKQRAERAAGLDGASKPEEQTCALQIDCFVSIAAPSEWQE